MSYGCRVRFYGCSLTGVVRIFTGVCLTGVDLRFTGDQDDVLQLLCDV